jgi:fluoroquinolone transport system ATP-binding protein
MIDIENLDFTYKASGKHAIKSIDFHIDKGEIFGFLGPSGAGKTTTQHLIIGLNQGYSGKITIMGKERSAWNKAFYEHIGVAFDFPNLYLKLTGEENLKLIASYYKKCDVDFDGLFEKVGLSSDKKTKVESYSKGMKMRLNFIRSVMHDPSILFFDEPTSGLDPVNAKIIKDTILDLKQRGKTIFLTTHNMTVARQLCDRVAFMNEGEIVATDSPQNLMIDNGKSLVDITYMDENKRETVTFDLESIGNNQKFERLLKTKTILTMHSKEATLEDVFIKYTGRKLS